MRDSTIIVGDCVEVMGGMDAGSVHCVVTSPPYWGLRDYGVDGQIGLEATPDAYIETMVAVFREVKRILRDDGTLWLNLGDSYWNGGAEKRDGGHGFVDGGKVKLEAAKGTRLAGVCTAPGLKPKDLCGIPWRVALALQADGWWLRSAMPWVKRSAMPESCTDRPASALEYVFLLTKKPKYYFDMEAVRVEAAAATHARDKYTRILENDGPQSVRHDHETQVSPNGRAFRNTDLFYASLKAPHGMIFAGDEPVGLDVNPEGFKAAHFATFPRRLVEPLIKCGTSDRGCCPECGAPWRRVVERTQGMTLTEWRKSKGLNVAKQGKGKLGDPRQSETSPQGYGGELPRYYKEVFGSSNGPPPKRTVGWEQGCKHGHEPIPCTVGDIFCGAGTTGVVATQLGRKFIGIELSETYAAMAEKRIANPEPVAEIPDAAGQEVMAFSTPS